MIWVRIFDDVDVEYFADHVLPSLAFTHLFELLLEPDFQVMERESVPLQLLEQVEYCAKREEQFLMLHENVELLVKGVVRVVHDLLHYCHNNREILRLKEVFNKENLDDILNVYFLHILIINNFINDVTELCLSYELLGEVLNGSLITFFYSGFKLYLCFVNFF